MLRALLYDPSTGTLHQGAAELVDTWRSTPGATLWLDLENPDPAAEAPLLKTIGLHPLAIQDAQRTRHPPKIEAFQDHTFILLKGLSGHFDHFELETIQSAFFVGDNFLVTRRTGRSTSATWLWDSTLADHTQIATGSDHLAITLAKKMVGRYVDKILTLEPRLETLEDELVENTTDETLTELIGHKTNLKRYRRIFLYHQQVFGRLRSTPHPGITAARQHEITDVFEHQERATSLATLYYELASDLIDGYLSLSSHRLNHIMKVLTVVMAIFVPLTFIAGIYGMNFTNIPELQHPHGYFILLAVMLVVALALLALFRKKRWL